VRERRNSGNLRPINDSGGIVKSRHFIFVVAFVLCVVRPLRADQIKPDPQPLFPNSGGNSPITLPPIDLRLDPESPSSLIHPGFIEPTISAPAQTQPAGTGEATRTRLIDPPSRWTPTPSHDDSATIDRGFFDTQRPPGHAQDEETLSNTVLGVLAGGSGLAAIAAAYALYMWWRERNAPIKPIYMEPSPPPEPIPPRPPRGIRTR